MREKSIEGLRVRVGLVALLIGFAPTMVQGVPGFTRQTGQQCAACHTVFPELTAFGRQFKLRGFTLGSGLEEKPFPQNLPLSATVVVSRNSTKNRQGVETEMIEDDGKTVAQLAGIYYSGKITDKVGALAQFNRNGIENKGEIEMLDVRYANSTSFGNGKELLYGLTLNNSPTVSDIYNSTPMWEFPHIGSEKTVMPAASALIDMNLSSQVGGVGVYGFWDGFLYGEAALYRTAKSGIMRPLGAGVTTENVVKNYAPYWRLAVERTWDAHTLSVGAFGMEAKVYPDAVDVTTPTNRFRDVALDAQYHFSADNHLLSVHGLWIRESQRWDASFPMGLTSNPSSTLRTQRADVHYFYQRRYGGGIGLFSTRADEDQLRYNTGEAVTGSAAGKPDSSGWNMELTYLPLQNIKIGLRYTAYRKFNGGTTNYDGMGRNASDNNTTFLYGWFLF